MIRSHSVFFARSTYVSAKDINTSPHISTSRMSCFPFLKHRLWEQLCWHLRLGFRIYSALSTLSRLRTPTCVSPGNRHSLPSDRPTGAPADGQERKESARRALLSPGPIKVTSGQRHPSRPPPCPLFWWLLCLAAPPAPSGFLQYPCACWC